MDRTAANIVAFSANNRVAQYSTFLKDQLSGKYRTVEESPKGRI